ncbi:DUF2218 domain-containing protein [Ornithinimicrobium sufpigmenti]|uniref:DUF2218 domain-containing protein n=1 Tax=Ornithinimicrobium sufpigmenti TaxID=2508882 RepID=UPI00192DAAA0|nr:MULTISPECIES: DUF2218 domain-containing protein [unclassified Ornithinimicrobium]
MTQPMSTTTQTRTALVATDAPARYAKQLGSHLGRKMTLTETDRGPHLSMSFEGLEATCLMDTTAPDTLGLHVDAATAEAADRMALVVGSHLERFGAKAELQVSWTS